MSEQLSIKEKNRAYYLANREHLIAAEKARRLKDPERIKTYKKRYYRENKDLIGAKKHADRRTPSSRYHTLKFHHGRRWDSTPLSFEDFSRLIEMPCHYCIGPLNETGRGLDRKDSDVGYELHNVVPCCKECNILKGVLPYRAFLAAVPYIWEKK